MKPVDQTSFGRKDGNCFQASVASILELDLGSVPHFCLYEDWLKILEVFLDGFGLFSLEIITKSVEGDPVPIPPDAFHIMNGVGPRGIKHAVVGKGGKMVHDPHPDRSGLTEVESFTFFICRDPSEMTRSG